MSSGNYYTGPGATGQILNTGDIILTSQKIYIYNIFNNRNGPCIDESSFFVTVAKPILFTPPNPRILCDEDGINDGETNIVSTTLTEDILSGLPLPPSDYNVDYFDNSTDASLGTNPIFKLKSQKIFFRIYNKATPTCFSDIGNVDVVVSKIPEPNPKGGFICVDKNIPFIINSDLSTANYTFEWYNNNASTLMPSETSNSISVTIPDTYGVKATDNISNCSSKIIAVDVIGSSAPINISFTSSEAFEDNQMVTVIATGNGGDYEYQLDFGPFQDSPNFTNIPPGEHIFTVRDKNGCGSTTKSITLINYPKYFTPNSDGYNETWNIIGLERQASSIVYIYDRYGKLLKQIKPSGFGWDGTYNGRQLPSSDYWFNVLYEENGVTREFKSHFSLKR
ncbi:MAG: T9SS type B sorting domain-containing protein [Flavobacterium sp.]|nr:T9SS type B sorting domain-containing protein [Flavobacterium sp.]